MKSKCVSVYICMYACTVHVNAYTCKCMYMYMHILNAKQFSKYRPMRTSHFSFISTHSSFKTLLITPNQDTCTCKDYSLKNELH